MDKLIEITDIKTNIIGYTGENSFNKKFYNENKCYVHENLINNLKKINKKLKKKNLELCIVDAYRPLSVQKELFILMNGDTRYISDPDKSRHCRGTAVDVTLYNKDGNELEMPTKISEFTEKSNAYAECNEIAKKNRQILQNIMTSNGFNIYVYEWWHFDFNGWENDDIYPILDFKI